MSKKILRRVSSVAAGSALVATSLVAAPAAYAVDAVSLTPYYGTTYVAAQDENENTGLVLSTIYGVGNIVNPANLKYLVEIVNDGVTYGNAAGQIGPTGQASADFDAYTVLATQVTTTAGGNDLKEANGDNVANAATVAVVPGSDNKKFVITPAVITPANGANHLLYITLANFDGPDADTKFEDLNLKVTAWVDSVNDGVISNEYASPTRDVTFKAPQSVSFSGAFDYLPVGQNTAVTAGKFGFTANVDSKNLLEVLTDAGTAFDVDFGGSGTPSDTTNNAVSWNATLSRLEASTGNLGTLTAGTVTADVRINNKPYGIEDGLDANRYFATNEDDSVTTLTLAADQLAGANASVKLTVATSTAVAQDTGLIGGDGNVVALEGSKTLSYTIQGMTDATTAAGAGIVYVVTIEDNDSTFAADATTETGDTALGTTTITAGAKTLKATGDNAISFSLTSDINGRATFDVTADKAVAGEGFRIKVSAENGAETDSTVVKWQAAAVQLVTYPTTAASGTVQIAPGGSSTIEMQVSDQFGNVPAGTHQIAVTRTAIAGTTAQRDEVAEYANWSYAVPVSSAGRATVTITDNGSATLEGSDTVSLQVQSLATSGGGYVNALGAAAAKSFTLKYENDLKAAVLDAVVNNNGVKAGTTDVKPIALETLTPVNWDSRISSATKPLYADNNVFANALAATTASGLVKITGSLKTAAGVGIANVPVKVSGDGLIFANGATMAATTMVMQDSMVVNTVAGAYEVYVRGALSGKQTVTIAVGSLSKTIDLTFAAGSVQASAMTLDVAASSAAGKTVDVVAKVTDAAGKPASGVTVTFKSTGPGYLNAASGVTDAAGEVVVKLITLPADTGTAVVTATSSLKGVSTSVVKSVVIGGVSSSEQKVNAGSFKGYVALYAKGYAGQRMSAKVGKDWVVVPVLASNFERVVEFTGAGYTISVPIYIDRVLVDTITVTTK